MTSNEDILNELNGMNKGNGNEISPKNCLRVVLMGKSKSGKSQVVNWLLSRRFNDSYFPTIEDFHVKIFKIKGETYRIEILDTSGNDPFPAVHKLNIMSGDIFILPFSIDDIDSYNQVKQNCQEIREIKKGKKNFPILILGNKIDFINENSSKKRCVDASYVELFASTVKSCIYAEVSCKSSKGLEDAFQRLFSQAYLPVEMLPSKHRRIYLNSSQFRSPEPNNFSQIDEKYSVANKRGRLNKKKNNNQHDGAGGGSGDVIKEGSLNKLKKRMTFRITLNDAKACTEFNTRRPSIQTELNLLQTKAKCKNLNRRHPSRFDAFAFSFRKLLCLKLRKNDQKKNL